MTIIGNYSGGFFDGCTGYTWAWGPAAGGSGSGQPGEYGEHFWTSNSGNRGFTQDVYFRDYKIEDVALSDTFETWRQKTNTEIIEKLNLVRVYGATYGDGIMVANSTGGTLAIAFSGNVMRQNVTFCNDVYIGNQLSVGGKSLVVSDTTGGITLGHNFTENILVLNHAETPNIGSHYAGLVIGGGASGEWYRDGSPVNPVVDSGGDGGDVDGAFAFDRPYMLHKDGLWRTKEGLWLEGKLLHQEVFGGTGGVYNHAHVGSTSDAYPNGPYGYTGSTFDSSNPYFTGKHNEGASGGVVRLFFGPTLAGYNFLDIDGRGGRAGVTGTAWHDINTGDAPVGGKTGALVIGNTAGPLLDFDDYGYTNIYRGVNKKIINKNNHGFIFGESVRYSGITHGYTFASAMGQFEPNGDFLNAAEVVGVVSNVVDSDTFEITFSGEVAGTTAEWNSVIVDDSSNGLVPGSVYFLSTYGGANVGLLQHQKPDVAGYVNKPVVLALDSIRQPSSSTDADVSGLRQKQTALILHYRGQYLSPTGCSAGTSLAGASGDDATMFELPYASGSFSIGDWVCFDSQSKSGNVFRKAHTKTLELSNVIGVITYVDTVTNFVRIATSGTVLFTTTPAWAPGIAHGSIYLSETAGEATSKPRGSFSVKLAELVNPRTLVIRIAPVVGDATSMSGMTSRVRGELVGTNLRIIGSSGGTGETFDNVRRVNRNELFNPDFSIWQRGIGLTADGYGTVGYTATNNTYFADRWIRVSQTGTGPNANNPFHGVSGGTHRTYDYMLKRGSFVKKETVVEGHPDYYAIIKGGIAFAGGTNSNEFYRVEQRLEDVTSFAGQVMTASFYAKGGATGICHLAWIQNLDGTTGAAPGATLGGGSNERNGRGVTANEIITSISDFELTTTWNRYAYSFFVPECSGVAGSSGANNYPLTHPGRTADHFASIAFYTQITGTPDNIDKNIYFSNELHLSQVKLERGSVSTPFSTINYNTELRRCWRYYQTSYEYGKFPTSYTMRTVKNPDTSGVHFMVPNNKSYVYEYPERLRKSPACRLWSPTGQLSEGFNKDAGQDMRYTAGGKGFNKELRTTNANQLNISCLSNTPNAIEIATRRGAARLDSIVVHYEADAEINSALPTKVK